MSAEPSRDGFTRGRSAFGSRMAELAAGLSANALLDYGFNWVLYPVVIYHYGVWHGGFIMALASFAVCLALFRLYDWSKRDWLGIEAIKDLKGYDGEAKIGHFTSWFLKRSEPAIFLFLAIRYDPFVTTAYLRHGRYNGMNRRDWTIFTSSSIVSNAYWTLAVYMGISLVEWGWKTVAQ